MEHLLLTDVLYEDARLLFASDSITDVLGYSPQDVVGRSCFEYFHPDEMPFARSVHGRGVNLDKAAVLSYCKLKSITGEYVTCECVFTVVYSVIVASTSLYRYNNKSHGCLHFQFSCPRVELDQRWGFIWYLC